ncbi:hypothetical protein [Polaromonas sp.]|uniref:hypothetical protein n=1 Tax=Polaromonas sp. TaxID=1869339 RepID=UPI00286A2953|nr:hypothetical protein [Polaromonas sp.]
MKDSLTGTRVFSPPLQQQPRRPMDRQQQQSSGSHEFQPRPTQAGAPQDGGNKDKQMGEGSYEGSRDYQDSVDNYLKKADVKSDAQAAKPGSPEEAAALKKAEQQGLSHSKAPGQ